MRTSSNFMDQGLFIDFSLHENVGRKNSDQLSSEEMCLYNVIIGQLRYNRCVNAFTAMILVRLLKFLTATKPLQIFAIQARVPTYSL